MSERHKKPTIVDVAVAAGVSRTQASDALNGRGRVDAGTRERVVAVAAELGYRASFSARSLRSGRSGAIALLLPDISGAAGAAESWGTETYVRTTVAATLAAFAHGYALTLIPSDEWLGNVAVDGVIVTDPERNDARITALEQLEIPYVTIEPDLGREQTWFVRSDTTRSTRLMLDHLAAVGAGQIALVVPDASWAWSNEGVTAYREWSLANGREPQVVLTPLTSLEGSSYETCKRLLSGPGRPDVVFAWADRYALGALRAATELGLSIPDDLMIVGGVDSPTNRIVSPSITAIEIREEQAAAAAVELLVKRICGEAFERAPVIDGEVIVRESTRRA